jgi:hypothetical protein
LKDNAKYGIGEEFDIPDKTDSGVLKDEETVLQYGKDGEKKHNNKIFQNRLRNSLSASFSIV